MHRNKGQQTRDVSKELFSNLARLLDKNWLNNVIINKYVVIIFNIFNVLCNLFL